MAHKRHLNESIDKIHIFLGQDLLQVCHHPCTRGRQVFRSEDVHGINGTVPGFRQSGRKQKITAIKRSVIQFIRIPCVLCKSQSSIEYTHHHIFLCNGNDAKLIRCVLGMMLNSPVVVQGVHDG